MASEKSFLFLQGSYSRFTRELADALASRGHRVTKVHFYGGDRWFWGRDPRALDFRAPFAELEGFYRELFAERGITDIVMFNDSRPVHRLASELAEAAGINVFVMEEGYLRPHWITLEWGGMNGHSWLSSDPDWFRRRAAQLPEHEPYEPVGGAMGHRVRHDLLNTAALYLMWWRYPRYRTHRPYSILLEYAFWLKRLLTLKRAQRRADGLVQRLLAENARYFVFPLQLDPDVQVRFHSPFGGMVPAIRAVIRSFAEHAPTDVRLVIKNHPLDNGMIGYRKLVRRAAESCGVSGRVDFIDGGDLNALIGGSLGTVLVNSTVGLAALDLGKPLIALGKAIYDLEGISFQGSLDDFWTADFQHDPELLAAFRRVITHDVLVNGNFYTDEGIAAAKRNALRRLESPQPPYGERPPRPVCDQAFPERVTLTGEDA